MLKKLFQIFTGHSNNRVNEFEMSFGHQCAGKGEHGTIVGTWVKEGHKREITIAYFFNGRDRGPKLTPKVVEEMFHHARMVGIEPSHVSSYNGMSPPRNPR